MILSKFNIDIRNYKGRQCMADCQKMHRSIMRMFHCSRQEGNVLYRFHSPQKAVYILSEREPDLMDIPEGMIFCSKKDMGAWEAKIEEGQCFRFDLLAAPMKKVAEEGVKHSRRRFLRTLQERLDWLARKAEQSGFSLIQVQENTDVSIYGAHAEDAGGKFYSHAVSYQGILKVQDREKFYMAWKKGIGAGKAYGQGMLLLVTAD